MRLIYLFAVLIAAILHASGTAISTTKESNQGIISNVASTDISQAVDTVQEDGGRRLRQNAKHDAKTIDNEIHEEERGFMEALKKSAAKKLPWTESGKAAREAKKLAEGLKRWERMQSNIRYATS